MNVYEEVKKAIRKVAPGLDESKIVPGALLKEDLEIDSLDRVELTLELENATRFLRDGRRSRQHLYRRRHSLFNRSESKRTH